MAGRCNIVPTLQDERLQNVMVTPPQVTVIVTNYNYSRYLESCLESIARQTYPHFRCVIVDDCSTDNSVDIVNAFIASSLAERRFSLVCHEENKGQMGGFRTGLSNSEGPFLVYVDADDILLEDFIEIHVRAHTEFEPVAFTSSNQYQINESGEVIAGTHSDLKAKGQYRYVMSSPIHMPFWVWATTSSIMFRRAVLELIMPDEDDNYRICADNYICHFANLVGNSLLIPTVHGCYRRHGSNQFSSNLMVGGPHPTGDMERHPKDHIIRLNIFTIMLKRHQLFAPVISLGRLATLFAYTVGPYELLKYRKRLPKRITLWRLLYYSLYVRLKQIIRIWVAFLSNEQVNFNYGKSVSILKIPGR